MSDDSHTPDPFRNTEIRASAGTGKTYSLSVRYLGLLHQDVPVDSLLATTFTRKAAGEISARLFQLLAKAVLDPDQLSLLVKQLGPELDQQRSEELLAALSSNLHRIRVGTLDSFFARIARSFCFEVTLPPDWQIIDKVRKSQITDQSISAVMKSYLGTTANRLQSLLPRGEAQRRLAAVVTETVDNLHGLYKDTTEDCWSDADAGTLLSSQELVALLEKLESAPLPDNARIETDRAGNIAAAREGEWDSILRKGIVLKIAVGDATDTTPVFHGQEIPAGTADLFRTLAQHAAASLLQPFLRQTKATYQLLDAFSAHYEDLLAEAGVLEFSDVTRHLAGPNGKSLSVDGGYRLDATIDHLLLDEFQDTSLLQWQVIKPLAASVADSDSGNSSLFCVGDTKQAIYGWRGGQSEIFDALEGQLGATIHKAPLDLSYRSAPPIIEAVNHVFSNLLQHDNLEGQEPAVSQWAAQFPQHATIKEFDGGVEFVAAPCLNKSKDAVEAGTLDRMTELVCEISSHAPTCSIGVLVRKNDYAQAAIQSLRQAGLEVSGEGGVTLDDTSPNQALLSLLALVDHPGDSLALHHVIHSPLGAIVSLTTESSRDDIHGVIDNLRMQLQAAGYGPTLEGIAKQLTSYCSLRQTYRLFQLVEQGYAFQPLRPTRTNEFLSFITLTPVEDPNSARIRVMTINAAKGLEFDAVVLPQLHTSVVGRAQDFVVGRSVPTGPIERVMRYCSANIQSFLPDEMRKMFSDSVQQQVNDSLCLLYVAFTRAVHGLHVILPAATWQNSYPKTMAGIVQAAIGAPPALAADLDLLSFGNTTWYRDHKPEAGHAPIHGGCGTAQVRTIEPVAGLGLAPVREGGRLEPVTPSSLEGSRVLEQHSLLEMGRVQAMQRGTLVHGWCEQIDWLENGLPGEETMLRDVRAAGLENSAIAEFLQGLEAPAIQRLLTAASYDSLTDEECCPQMLAVLKDGDYELSVHNEFPMSSIDGLTHLHGSVDRLVLIRRDGEPVAADIIDFKTDRLDETSDEQNVQALTEHYRGQIECYARGISQTLQIPADHINLRLVFLQSGIVTPVVPL